MVNRKEKISKNKLPKKKTCKPKNGVSKKKPKPKKNKFKLPKSLKIILIIEMENAKKNKKEFRLQDNLNNKLPLVLSTRS